MSDPARFQGQLDSRALELASEARQMARDAREECRSEYGELRTEFRQHQADTIRRFERQDAERNRMHAENQVKFDKLFRALYIAIGLGMAASTVLSLIVATARYWGHP